MMKFRSARETGGELTNTQLFPGFITTNNHKETTNIMPYDNEELVADEFKNLFAAAESKRGTAGRLEQLSALHQLFINDYSETFLPVVISASGKTLSANSQDSYRSGIVSALLKMRRGEKLTSDENSYTRMFKRYMSLVEEFVEDTDEDDDEDVD